MTTQDFFITPIWFFFLLFGAYVIRPYVTNVHTRPYFIPGLLAKFVGAIAIGMVYQFYYAWGDTYTYFREATIIWKIFLNQPIDALRLIFQYSENVQDLFYHTYRIWTFRSPNNFAMVRILSFVNLFTLNTYSATSLLFAAFSFSGSWAFYSVLSIKYNHANKWLAISILFIPSVIIWGSGIFKDTLTFGALMWLTWSAFKYAEFNKMNFSTLSMGTISILIIGSIKVYILICYLPLVIFWIVSKKITNIKNQALRYITFPVFITLGLIVALLSAQQASSVDEKYALENIASTAQITAYDIAYYSGKGGSTYTLGELDGSWGSMIVLAPQAINVSIFRPYLWEVSNPFMLLSALESLALFLLTIGAIFFKPKKMRKVLTDPFFLLCLSFSILFAFAVGISTYNFGTLVRYKIPLMPFYAVILTLIFNKE
ncbi:MAG: hypothetical protein JXR07_20030 [Reichenbachiella sp.]